jgi:hypothetical protein
MAFPYYTQWPLSSAISYVQRELMDPNGRWWTPGELTQYINDWQNELQQDYEFVWGSATVTLTGTATFTFTGSALSPPMGRLEAVYWIGTDPSFGFRLSGRLIEDLEVGNPVWRSVPMDTPRSVVQYDSTQFTVYPEPNVVSTYIFEYPQLLDGSLISGTSTISLPAWTQWSMKPYVAMRAYKRPGPANDPKRSMRYAAKWTKAKAQVKLLWDNYLPERYRRLKPRGHYEKDIIHPPPAWATGTSTT